MDVGSLERPAPPLLQLIRGPPRRSRGQKGVSIMFIVEWTDHEGNLNQREFDTLEDAQLEATSLETEFDHVAIITEVEV